MKTRESLFNELNDLRQQILGISPKLSIYASLRQREKEILIALGDIHVDTPRIQDQINLKTGLKYVNKFQKPR